MSDDRQMGDLTLFLSTHPLGRCWEKENGVWAKKENAMVVRWWQGGVFVQPESDVECEALNVLMNAVRYERPSENDDPRKKPTDQMKGGSVDLGSQLGDVL